MQSSSYTTLWFPTRDIICASIHPFDWEMSSFILLPPTLSILNSWWVNLRNEADKPKNVLATSKLDIDVMSL